MADAPAGDLRRAPKDRAEPRAPYIDPRTFSKHEDLVGDGMSPLPVIAGLLVTAAIVAGMFVLAA